MLLVKLELNPQEVELFKEFRRHQEIFNTLAQAGVFNIKGGSVELHFNADGVLMDVVRPKVSVFHRSTVDKNT